MDWTTLVTAVVGLLSVLITNAVSKKKNLAEAKKISYQADSLLADNYERFTEKLERQIVALETENAKVRLLEQDVLNLRNKIILLESAHIDIPIPMWLKDLNGVILALNDEYEKTFLRPNGKSTADCIGKTDTAVWGPQIGAAFHNKHVFVLRTGKVLNGMEKVVIAGEEVEFLIVSFVRYAGGIKIGTGGMAIIPE